MTPEKLSLWDRFFNRYRREVAERGTEAWCKQMPYSGKIAGSEYMRDYVDYKIVDRLTGSESLEREYLN